ncbi:MAG: Phosphoesterase family protein [Sphingobacteriaceae bacterium]|jgi:YVTN family beta-propeller protein|nr:Phosphoesterase family protein [Sphingobacteriaceae bacterium]
MLVKNASLIIVAIFLAGCVSSKLADRLKNGTDDSRFAKQSKAGPQKDGSYIVPTSQTITPAGKTVTFPGRPFDIALNPDETILAVKNMTNLVFLDVKTRGIIQTLKLPNRGNSFKGIGWSADGKKVWATDESGNLRSAKMDSNGEFAWSDVIALPGNDKKGPYPGGFVIDDSRNLIYVTLNRTNKLGIVDLNTGKLVDQIDVGVAPYAVVLKDNKAYVSNWGGRHPKEGELWAPSSGTPVLIDKETGILSSGTVSVIDLVQRKQIAEIPVNLHPSGMAFSPDKSMLYVANANSDNVSVINTQTDKVVKTISSKPMEELPFGSAPNDVGVSPDGKTLYIADGGDNLLAVVDLQKGKLTGLIPTGWYPSAVELSKDGKKIFVANLKGIGSWAPSKKDPDRDMNVSGTMLGKGHNTHDQMGSVSFIDVPDADSLQKLTITAATNMRLPKINQELSLTAVKERLVPVPTQPGEKSPIKHILYIIKENRTYDQVLGDMPQGNGDSSLCMFGRRITPNHHKLAEEFVLLDNTYCNGVKSVEGHQWTSQGYVTDYLEKGFPSFVRGYPWNGGDPLVYAGSGFIWDYVLRAGLSFRDYGEYVSEDITPAKFIWKDVYNDVMNGTENVKIRAVPTVHTLQGNFCPNYTGGPREINDQYKANVFIKELHEFEKSGSMPNLMMMSLPNDHTSGTQEGFPIPNAMVADNDLALGRIVEAVSNSKFWKETAIFVIEDDPQFGLDHVDGHRTVAYCISPYTKRKAVVSTHYNQNSILRTIQLILGLPPMSQFDLVAMPMTDCFIDTPDLTPYKHLPNNIPLNLMNPKLSSLSGKQLYWAKQSMKMNLQENDDLEHEEEIALNKVLWHSTKGYNVPYPKTTKK